MLCTSVDKEGNFIVCGIN